MGETAWHAVRTRTGREADARIGVEAAGFAAVYLPVEICRLGLRGNRRYGDVVWRPVFSQHLFARLDPAHDLSRLRAIDGIDDAVKLNGRPAAIADDVIDAIRAAERAGRFDHAANCRLIAGDEPPIDGRFAWVIARIRKARWASERNGVLMAVLMCKC
jgi:hypothetical protein